MLISIDLWRASGAYALTYKLTKLKLNKIEFFISYFLTTILLLLKLLHIYIEYNPGTKKKEQICFSICHWNINSFVAHGKISLLATYN